MRKKDINKVTAIKQAVLDLSQAQGLSSLTTAKIAKDAGVSPATIYLYYEDKTDLLSRLYEEVKINLHDGLDQVINTDQTLDIQIQQMISYSVSQYQKNSKQANFMSTLWSNQELLDQKAINFGSTLEDPLTELLERIQRSDSYMDVSLDILNIFLSVPTLILEVSPQLSEEEMI